MSTEQKTTSRELSQKLKAAGAKQVSEKVWCRLKTSGRPFVAMRLWAEESGEVEVVCASFDCHELLERLPDDPVICQAIHLVRYSKGHGADGYGAWFVGIAGGKYGQHPDAFIYPAEALGNLYLWCLENGHCEKEE